MSVTLGLSGLVSHPTWIAERYNKLLDKIGVEGMLIAAERYLDTEQIVELLTEWEDSLKVSSKTQIFCDADGNELRVGDMVVAIDVDDLDIGGKQALSRGDALVVIDLDDLETNLIKFFVNNSEQPENMFMSIYGHRVLKLNKSK